MPIVKLNVYHNLLDTTFFEIRFDTASSVMSVKQRIYQLSGTPPQHQALTLRNQAGDAVAAVSGDDSPLGLFCPPDAAEGYTLDCRDTNPHSMAANGGLQDLSRVEKYEMADHVYDEREDSVRNWKRKLAEDPEVQAKIAARKAAADAQREKLEQAASAVAVGDRCEIVGGNRGTVRFVGDIPELKPGVWVGIELDEPVGRHSGEAKGRQVFECAPRCGLFLRPTQAKFGEYPPVDDLDLDSEDEL
jgi:tubulin-folding cofactor B